MLRDPRCRRDGNSLGLPASSKAAWILVQHGFALSSPSLDLQHLLWDLRDHPWKEALAGLQQHRGLPVLQVTHDSAVTWDEDLPSDLQGTAASQE